MAKNDRNLPKKLVQGGTRKSQAAKAPEIGGSGKINTSFQEIKWTPKKLGLVIAFLSIPYILVVISAIKSGNIFVAYILIGIVVFIGLLYLLLRWIENADF